jgi:hypothetical protein
LRTSSHPQPPKGRQDSEEEGIAEKELLGISKVIRKFGGSSPVSYRFATDFMKKLLYLIIDEAKQLSDKVMAQFHK